MAGATDFTQPTMDQYLSGSGVPPSRAERARRAAMERERAAQAAAAAGGQQQDAQKADTQRPPPPPKLHAEGDDADMELQRVIEASKVRACSSIDWSCI